MRQKGNNTCQNCPQIHNNPSELHFDLLSSHLLIFPCLVALSMAQKGRRILVTYFLFSCAGLLLRKQPTSSTHPGPASSMWLSSSSNSSCSSSSCCWFPIIRPMPSSSCSCFLLLLVAILHLIASCQAADQYAYIAFANDVHNRLEEEDPTTSTPCSPKARAAGICVGGWPRISTAVKSLRLQAAREGAGFFFLDAGDEFTGTLWDAVYQGNTVAPLLLNNVKPDVMVRALLLAASSVQPQAQADCLHRLSTGQGTGVLCCHQPPACLPACLLLVLRRRWAIMVGWLQAAEAYLFLAAPKPLGPSHRHDSPSARTSSNSVNQSRCNASPTDVLHARHVFACRV